MYNPVEYSDNYSDTSESLWQFKRDEINGNADVTTDNSSSFKYKSDLVGDGAADGTVKGVKTGGPFKYLSNFRHSLEMPLIDCKVDFELTWGEKCMQLTLSNSNLYSNLSIIRTNSKSSSIFLKKLL